MDDEMIEFPVIDGIDWDYGRLHFSDMDDLLYETTEEYYATLGENIGKIEAAYAMVETPEGLNTDRIETHSVKSTSALIGAIQLHGLAKSAEYAAKESDYETIRAITPILLKEMRNMQTKLAPMFSNKGGGEKIPVEPAKVLAIVSILRYAMSRMDVDTLDDKVKLLGQYDFDESTAGLIDQLRASTMNLDSVKTNDLLDRLEERFDD